MFVRRCGIIIQSPDKENGPPTAEREHLCPRFGFIFGKTIHHLVADQLHQTPCTLEVVSYKLYSSFYLYQHIHKNSYRFSDYTQPCLGSRESILQQGRCGNGFMIPDFSDLTTYPIYHSASVSEKEQWATSTGGLAKELAYRQLYRVGEQSSIIPNSLCLDK